MNGKLISIVVLTTFLLPARLFGGPVKDASAVYFQPDGTSFTVMLAGDEWMKIRTTADGCPVVKDESGWWCYAAYDNEGKLKNTGYRVGDILPQEIAAGCRQIPYDILVNRAMSRRIIGGEDPAAQIEGIRRQAAVTKSGTGKIQKRGIALLVEFSDVKFKFSKEDFFNLLNQKNYNNTGSAKDYYEAQFGPDWEFTFDVSDIITLDWPVVHYGANDADGEDARPCEMVAEACAAADETIDFSLYDQDNDGEVDNVYVFFAGLSESEHTNQPDLIWPHQYYIYSGTSRIDLKLDGKRIDRYACSSEIAGDRSMASIGSFCHEYGHTFGLKDLYDTDYDKKGGWAAGTWRYTSVMDGGNYNNNSATPPNFNCIEREMLGLSEPVLLEEGKSYTLDPIHKNGLYYKLETDTKGEYYLFECRSKEGWDEYIRGSGMLIYHIDKNMKENGSSKWHMNTVNTLAQHQCADLIEADGRRDAINTSSDFQRDLSGIFFPQDDVTSLTPLSTPSLKYWNGNVSNLSITGIQKSGDNISFNIVNSMDVSDVPNASNVTYITFPEAALIYFESSDPSMDCSPIVQWKKNGTTEYQEAKVSEYEKGKYACMISGLKNGNVSYDVSIRFHSDISIGVSTPISFMTKRISPVEWPYIYIDSDLWEQRQGIALYVANATEATKIEWTYDGTRIQADKDQLYHPDKSGTLKAVVKWKDGGTDIIIKEIKVK